MTTVEWLKKLISFDTTSYKSNLALIEMIENYLLEQQFKIRKTFNADYSKANLFATKPAANGEIHGGLILSGHTDVVPVKNQNWTSDPFTARIADGKLYGRGSSDMKGFIAAALALAPKLNSKLAFPIHYAFSYDEEVGCLGAPVLIEDFQKENIKPLACIVGEPTSMRPVISHKGIQSYHCKVKGKAAHSSLPKEGVNAINYAARLVTFIEKLAHDLQEHGEKDSKFDVPFSTISSNLISGGNAGNIIPSHCEFHFDLRNLPNTNPGEIVAKIQKFIDDELSPEMQKRDKDTSITLSENASVPSFTTDQSSRFVQSMLKILNEKDELKVAYATEAGQFQAANIQTCVCGPGSIEQAHKPDEFVTLEQLEKCDRFLEELISSNQFNL